MGNIGKYIYGIIINSNGALSPFGIGVCEEVYPIVYQDISAIVSDSEIVDYTSIPKDAVARLLVRHQEVIERMLPEHTIIPMRLGTFAIDSDEVTDILVKGYQLIKGISDKIFNKIENDVVATWSDFNSLLKEVGEEKELKEFKEQLLTNPKGVTVDDRMKVGLLVKKTLEAKREKYASRIEKTLKEIGQDVKTHELMDDQMVINTAFLINKHKQTDFDTRLEELNTEFNEKLNFRCVGPLPPYSFYTLEIKKLQYEETDWARKKLALNNYMSKNEVKKAYQKSAFVSHPDRNQDTPGMEKQFNEINKAYKILIDYCSAIEQTGQNDVCSFNEATVKKNALLVKLRE